jgi:hypothetical protein
VRKYETILCPVSMLMPHQLSEAQSFNRYMESEKRYEDEEAMRRDDYPRHLRIKAAWEGYGKNSFPEEAHAWQVAYMPRPSLPLKFEALEDLSAPVKYETFVFERAITRTKTHTVTRIYCEGITVSETVEPA